jgi:hypothetical protein
MHLSNASKRANMNRQILNMNIIIKTSLENNGIHIGKHSLKKKIF